jgi:hypothetical protein
MRDDGPRAVEDYTEAFLWSAYLVTITLLVVVWGVLGYLVALACCGGLHWAVGRVTERRARAEADWDARVAEAIARGYDRRD